LITRFFLKKKGNCAPDAKNPKTNICSEPVGTTLHIAPWQWGATGFCIIGGKLIIIIIINTTFRSLHFIPNCEIQLLQIVMVAISISLTFVHRRHRHERYKELREYYHEQMT